MSILGIYHDGGRLSIGVLNEATEEELIELKEAVDVDIVRIAYQIDEAKTHKITTGEYANPDWFRKATFAKRMKGQLSQRIQRLLGKKGKVRKATNREEHEKTQLGLLLRAVDEALSPELREKVHARWHELRSETSF